MMNDVGLACNLCGANPVNPVVATICGHLFCWSCLQNANQGCGCPLCIRTMHRNGTFLPIYGLGQTTADDPRINIPVAASNNESVIGWLFGRTIVAVGWNSIKFIMSFNLLDPPQNGIPVGNLLAEEDIVDLIIGLIGIFIFILYMIYT